jgi:predicted TIM-barrel enzyme
VATGQEAAAVEVDAVAAAVSIPVLVGSGITADNISQYAAADGFIVGSTVKRDGHWTGALEAARVGVLVAARDALNARTR